MAYTLKQFIVNTLRRSSYRWPPRYESMNKSKKERNQYECNGCKGVFTRKEISLDHVVPVVGPEGFTDWNTYIERMFVGPEGWQVLCKTCHDAKTKVENVGRKESKKRTKKKLTKTKK